MVIEKVLQERRSIREYSGDPIEQDEIKRLLTCILGKQDESGHRAVPSAHALYPLKILTTVGNVHGLGCGTYDFEPNKEKLSVLFTDDIRQQLCSDAIDEQPWIAEAACILTICGDAIAATTAFSDQPPFGTRGLRYLLLEAGAAAQTLLLAATDIGLGAVLVGGFHDEKTAQTLRLEAPYIAIAHICLGKVNRGCA